MSSEPERLDHRGEGLDLGGGAVEVEGDDGLLHADLGAPAVAADLLLDGADDVGVALAAPPPSRRGSPPRRGW